MIRGVEGGLIHAVSPYSQDLLSRDIRYSILSPSLTEGESYPFSVDHGGEDAKHHWKCKCEMMCHTNLWRIVPHDQREREGLSSP